MINHANFLLNNEHLQSNLLAIIIFSLLRTKTKTFSLHSLRVTDLKKKKNWLKPVVLTSMYEPPFYGYPT